MTTTTMTHKVSIRGEQNNPFGGIDQFLELDIWEDGAGQLLVRLMKDDGESKTFANKKFRDCETQHHDSERWLNDQIGYPNPFAGILSETAWR
jgi:hypothetical protein